jgi:predicted small metal-binding protein
MNAVRTRERGILVSYCRDLAERRFEQGFEAREVCNALRELNRIVFKHLRRDPESDGLREDIKHHVTMTLTWGCDEAQQEFEHLAVRCRNSHLRPSCQKRSEAAARRAALVSADGDESTP